MLDAARRISFVSPVTGASASSATENKASPPSASSDGTLGAINLLDKFGLGLDSTSTGATLTPRAHELLKKLANELNKGSVNAGTAKMPPGFGQANGVSETTKKQYPLLANLHVDVLSRTDTGIGIGCWNMQSMLSQMVHFMESQNKKIQYEAAHTKYTHHLLKVASRSSDNTWPDIRRVLKELFETGNASQLIGSILEYLLDHHKKETLSIL